MKRKRKTAREIFIVICLFLTIFLAVLFAFGRTEIPAVVYMSVCTACLFGGVAAKQQIGELIGVIVSAAAIGGVLYLLNEAWSYGSKELPAAQATMMKMLVEGIMNAELPWGLILIGVFIAIVVEIIKVPVMPFAVGMYLPFSLSAGIMAGGAVRFLVEKIKGTDEEKKARTDKGVLFTSGLIAGEGITGILLAGFAVAKLDVALKFSLPQVGSLIIFIALLGGLFALCMKAKPAKK